MNIDNRQMLPIGTQLKGGEYCVIRYIASGGFGNTYEIEHVRLGKHLALKEFFMRGINLREGTRVSVSQEDNRETFDQMREKFYKEAQRLALLEETHIVEVNDFFEENETAYYTMRLVDGQSLSAVMKQSGHPFTEQQVMQILPQVLEALKYVHSNDLYHLDLKPGNIMQNVQGHCWLIDFGASKQLSATESQTLSTSTGLCYTPGYAPSEQINGNTKRIGAWTDIYALGATLYNMLTGHTPPSPDDIMNDEEKAFAFPSAVSGNMRKLVIWMMQPRPADRPQNIGQIELSLQGKDSRPEKQRVYQHMTGGNDNGAETVISGSSSQETKLRVSKPSRKSGSGNVQATQDKENAGIWGILGFIFSLILVWGIIPYFLLRKKYPKTAKRCLWINLSVDAFFILMGILTHH